MKSYILILASIFCIAEASFRSDDALRASFRAAKAHTAIDAALIVISEAGGGQFRVSNGVYIGPGRAITHAHEDRSLRTWVISPFVGAKLIYKIVWNKVSGGISFNGSPFDIDETFITFPHACREVTAIRFPDRELREVICIGRVTEESVSFAALEELVIPEKFIKNTHASPLPILGSNLSLMGPDFCVLAFPAFDDDHPVARIRATPLTDAESLTVSVLGYSTKTHLYDGTNLMQDAIHDRNMKEVSSIISLKIQKRRALTSGVEHLRFPINFTTFTQVALVCNGKLIVQAVCGTRAENASPLVTYREIFDPERTDSRTQALTVEGLSGSGVYDENGNLVGLVSAGYADELEFEPFIEQQKVAIAKQQALTALLKLAQEKGTSANIALETAQAVVPSWFKVNTEANARAALMRLKASAGGIEDEAYRATETVLVEVLKRQVQRASCIENLRKFQKALDGTNERVATLERYLGMPKPLLDVHQIVTRADIDVVVGPDTGDGAPCSAGVSSSASYLSTAG